MIRKNIIYINAGIVGSTGESTLKIMIHNVSIF